VLSRTDTTMSMVFWLTLMLSVGGHAGALPEWAPIQDGDWGCWRCSGVSGSFGQYAITEAFGRGQASVVAPFRVHRARIRPRARRLIWHTRPDLGCWSGPR
jgi:hypothetical protein